MDYQKSLAKSAYNGGQSPEETTTNDNNLQNNGNKEINSNKTLSNFDANNDNETQNIEVAETGHRGLRYSLFYFVFLLFFFFFFFPPCIKK